jgi:hypothetical protein
MKRSGFLGLLGTLLCSILMAAHAQTDTNVYHLDLSGPGRLKNVFDSGLRPKKESVQTTYRCGVEDKIINFDLANNHSATIPVENCYFRTIGSNHALIEIIAETIPLTVAEARAWMFPICLNFRRAPAELDAFLEKVRNGYQRFGWLADENEGFGVGTPRPAPESGGAGMGVWLQYLAGDSNCPVRIFLRVEWERPRSASRDSPTAMLPPKGYEQFSMEPEETGPPYTATWIRKGHPAPGESQRKLGATGVQRLRDEYMAKKGLTNPPTPFHPAAPELPTSLVQTNIGLSPGRK